MKANAATPHRSRTHIFIPVVVAFILLTGAWISYIMWPRQDKVLLAVVIDATKSVDHAEEPVSSLEADSRISDVFWTEELDAARRACERYGSDSNVVVKTYWLVASESNLVEFQPKVLGHSNVDRPAQVTESSDYLRDIQDLVSNESTVGYGERRLVLIGDFRPDGASGLTEAEVDSGVVSSAFSKEHGWEERLRDWKVDLAFPSYTDKGGDAMRRRINWWKAWFGEWANVDNVSVADQYLK